MYTHLTMTPSLSLVPLSLSLPLSLFAHHSFFSSPSFFFTSHSSCSSRSRYFQTPRSSQGRKHFNCDLQQWNSAKCLIFFTFYICLPICRFVKGNLSTPHICTLFCLVDIKKRSFKVRSFLTFSVLPQSASLDELATAKRILIIIHVFIFHDNP